MSAQGSPPAEVPQDFRDPISFELMMDPVLLVETGHTYHRQSITNWFRRGHRTCPKTNRVLKSLLLSTNWSLRSLISSWADENGVILPSPTPASNTQTLALEAPPERTPSTALAIAGGSSAMSVESSGVDSPGGDILRLHFDNASAGMPQLIAAADKVPNCIAFNPSGYLKQSVLPRSQWIVAEDPSWSATDISSNQALDTISGPTGLYVRTQCLPFIESGCSSWAADAAMGVPADKDGWLQQLGGRCCNGGSGRQGRMSQAATAGQLVLHWRFRATRTVGPASQGWTPHVETSAKTFPGMDSPGGPSPQGWTPQAVTSAKTFFPGMDSPGGDICQAITTSDYNGLLPSHATGQDSTYTDYPIDSRVGPVITSSSSLALLAVARPFCVAFNSNGWLKALLQPMHGWVKWTTEAGKGLFVRNDVLTGLLGGVLAHVQGSHSAPVQLAGWTFFQGMDSLGGDVHWAWQNQNDVVKLAQDCAGIEGVIAFTTSGYLKTALRPRNEWLRVEGNTQGFGEEPTWVDRPMLGIYVNKAKLCKLLLR
eukprot:gene12212-15343_t